MCRVDALDAAARLAFLQNDYREAIALYEKSLKIRRQLASKNGDTRLKHGVVGVLNKIGLAALRNGDYAVAEKRLLEAMELGKETRHTRGIVGRWTTSPSSHGGKATIRERESVTKSVCSTHASNEGSRKICS